MSICVIGEGMLELSKSGDGWMLGYGGDTLNTAIHLARLGEQVSYVTALGTDPFSAEMRQAWEAEGLATNLVLLDPASQSGLYAIRTNESGERSFYYWRNDSAARGLFSLPGIDSVLAVAAEARLLCYSLITLAILPQAARTQLFALCNAVRKRGGRVAFDGNYRPRLWSSPDEARSARDAAAACCDIGLPTLADEMLLSGAASAAAVAAHWSDLGAAETIVKLGAEGCLIPGGTVVAPARVIDPVDTSGAGDAFNAGYLHARLAGDGVSIAALAGHRLAAWVITRPGAVPGRTPDAPYA